MAVLTLTMPDAVWALAQDALTALGNYQPNVRDPASPGKTKPNPVTAEAFAGQQITAWLTERVLTHHQQLGAVASRANAARKVQPAAIAVTVTQPAPPA